MSLTSRRIFDDVYLHIQNEAQNSSDVGELAEQQMQLQNFLHDQRAITRNLKPADSIYIEDANRQPVDPEIQSARVPH